MGHPPATVYVVDDDDSVRTALARLLRSAGFEPITFGSGTEFLAAHEPERFGCVILDLSMRECCGWEVQSTLAASGARRQIIFLTANGSIGASVRAIKAGAVDFLIKPVEERKLFAAIDEALRIENVERERRSLARIVERRVSRLTPRELEVLAHLLAGQMNKQIAAGLGTSEKTIKVHRARVMHKMGVRSLAGLVYLIVSAGLTSELSRFAGQLDLRPMRLLDRWFTLAPE
jgi:FixJ family two-component response regulator